MSTVGYGDVSPVTDEGHVVISILIAIGVLFMAIPVGVLGNAFSFAWKDRDLIMLVEMTRQQISQWGYQPTDLPKFFLLFDADKDGELNFDEFVNMMNALTVNLKGERMVNLFQLFDHDNGGTIEQKEILRAIYPRQYHKILKEEKAEKERELRRQKDKEEREQQRRRKKEREDRRQKMVASRPSPAEERCDLDTHLPQEDQSDRDTLTRSTSSPGPMQVQCTRLQDPRHPGHPQLMNSSTLLFRLGARTNQQAGHVRSWVRRQTYASSRATVLSALSVRDMRARRDTQVSAGGHTSRASRSSRSGNSLA